MSIKVGIYFMAKCFSFTVAQSVNGFIDPTFELIKFARQLTVNELLGRARSPNVAL
jgi:hypothetical protein